MDTINTLPHNGNCWAFYLHQQDMVKDGMNSTQLYNLCKSIAKTDRHLTLIQDNDFFEDLIYGLEHDLGYNLAL